MKTVAVPTSFRSSFPLVFVLACLGGLYLYTRRGGRVSDLVSKGVSQVGRVRSKIDRVAPSTTTSVAPSATI
jgi:hypothetical protein